MQTIGLAPLHAPATHVSDCVQALPSVQAAPSIFFGLLQVPAVHVPTLWHWSLAAQTTAAPPQRPLVQTSLVVHAFASSHNTPSTLLGLLHCPLARSQLPEPWHWSLAMHVTGAPPHVPPAHLSPDVQRFPSSHPALLLVNAHAPPLQASVVQALPSEQAIAAPATHVLPAHLSFSVQGLLSLHGDTLAACLQPAMGSQLSSVHGLPSSQLSGPPALHTPPTHASPAVHTVPSA